MFTGLIEEVGTIDQIRSSRGARLLRIAAKAVLDDLRIDDSISVSGVCLTVIERDERSFCVEAVEETLNRSTLGKRSVGDRVNLERALTLSRRLGGHLVQGHVDGVARVVGLRPQAGGKLLTLRLSDHLCRYVVPKGSIAVDGVSLTVVNVEPPQLDIALIPHTLEVTTLGALKPGDEVNIEVDLIGKYVLHWLEPYLRQANWSARYDVKQED